mmetsp:Transcript_248/g.1030  ORF Transcript_248/g.1030 Transcript_248/m.1030 type:complete len:271 (-) Transcript_248:1163-1975(-)
MVCLNQLTSCPQQKCCWYFLRITFSKSPRYRFASFTKDFPRGGSFGLIRSIASFFFSPDASSLTSVSVFPSSCFSFACPPFVSDTTRVTSVGNASEVSSRDISSSAALAAVFRNAFSASYSASFGSGVNFTGGEVNPTYGAGVTHRSVSAYSKRQSASATWSFPHVRIIWETKRKPARASFGVAGETPSAKGDDCENPGKSTPPPSRSAFNRANTFRASDPFAPNAFGPDPLPFIASIARRKIPFEPSQRWSTISASLSGRRNGKRHCPG